MGRHAGRWEGRCPVRWLAPVSRVVLVARRTLPDGERLPVAPVRRVDGRHDEPRVPRADRGAANACLLTVRARSPSPGPRRRRSRPARSTRRQRGSPQHSCLSRGRPCGCLVQRTTRRPTTGPGVRLREVVAEGQLRPLERRPTRTFELRRPCSIGDRVAARGRWAWAGTPSMSLSHGAVTGACGRPLLRADSRTHNSTQ